LPHQDAILVSPVVQVLIRVQSAAPDAKHVHVAVQSILQHAVHPLLGGIGLQHVEWDDVGALGIDWDAIHPATQQQSLITPLQLK
jgi:hypothetical protein